MSHIPERREQSMTPDLGRRLVAEAAFGSGAITSRATG
jgi:hypothetical protein